MEENEQTQGKTLAQQFEEIKVKQQKEIDELKRQINERDNLIQQYMTRPSSHGQPDVDSDEPFTANDVKSVVDMVIRKRT